MPFVHVLLLKFKFKNKASLEKQKEIKILKK